MNDDVMHWDIEEWRAWTAFACAALPRVTNTSETAIAENVARYADAFLVEFRKRRPFGPDGVKKR